MTERKTDVSDVRSYFTRAAVSFDSIYDGRRSGLMQAVDRRFRSDMFARFDLTFEMLGPLEGRTILDVGCGSGPYVLEAVRRGAASVVGIDLAPTMIELARQRLAAVDRPGSFDLRVGAFPEDARKETFDFAIVMGVMDYVKDPERFLSALAGTVTTRAVLSFPSRHWLRSPLRSVRYAAKRCPLFLFDEQRIRELLTGAGFEKLNVVKLPGAGMDFVVAAEKPERDAL